MDYFRKNRKDAAMEKEELVTHMKRCIHPQSDQNVEGKCGWGTRREPFAETANETHIEFTMWVTCKLNGETTQPFYLLFHCHVSLDAKNTENKITGTLLLEVNCFGVCYFFVWNRYSLRWFSLSTTYNRRWLCNTWKLFSDLLLFLANKIDLVRQ